MDKATRGTTVRDFLIFQLKLLLDGLKDVALIWLSVFALVLDLVAGRGRKRRLFYAVMRLGERFDLWLNLYRPSTGAGDDEDGLFGTSTAGSPTLLGKLEELIRGGDEPRSRRKGSGRPVRDAA